MRTNGECARGVAAEAPVRPAPQQPAGPRREVALSGLWLALALGVVLAQALWAAPELARATRELRAERLALRAEREGAAERGRRAAEVEGLREGAFARANLHAAKLLVAQEESLRLQREMNTRLKGE